MSSRIRGAGREKASSPIAYRTLSSENSLSIQQESEAKDIQTRQSCQNSVAPYDCNAYIQRKVSIEVGRTIYDRVYLLQWGVWLDKLDDEVLMAPINGKFLIKYYP